MDVPPRSWLCPALWALVAVSFGAGAQTYPTRPVRLIVADAPGGAPDQLARILAEKVSSGLGQQLVVDNRPGAGGVLGADLAAKAPSDGYTLLMTTTAIYAILPNLRKNLPYDPVKDFVPISRIATASNVLVVNNALAAKNVAELVKLAKEKPGVLNYGSAGIGTPAHLAGEMLNLMADIKVTHVPYKGAAPALQDVIAGNVQYIITSPIAAGAHMNSGRVRALATTGAVRNPSLPDLPTVAETVPGYEITQSWGIVAPAGTPPEIVRQLASEIGKAMNLPDVKEQVLKTGAVPAGDTPAEFDAFMAKERQRLGEVIARSGIVLTE
ncbi:MAG TPA: tripartite tricarboxylate transporter substrate binding protein [Casimicrobiaceae bacterium]|nr:tripartite tricarboxylate transporter substrate binding protein [Casimicrobiaceae bacterium]